MLVKAVLSRVHKIKSFVCEKARFNGDEIEVEIRPRKGSRPICSGCGRPGPGYDTLPQRRFAFVIAQKASQALHILDPFHIVAKLKKAIDEVRAAEAKELAAKGYEPLLKRSRWCLLKRVANLTASNQPGWPS